MNTIEYLLIDGLAGCRGMCILPDEFKRTKQLIAILVRLHKEILVNKIKMLYTTKVEFLAQQVISAEQAKRFSKVNLLTLHPVIIDEVVDATSKPLALNYMVGIRTHSDTTNGVNMIEVTFTGDKGTTHGMEVMLQFKMKVQYTDIFVKRTERRKEIEKIVEEKKTPVKGDVVEWSSVEYDEYKLANMKVPSERATNYRGYVKAVKIFNSGKRCDIIITHQILGAKTSRPLTHKLHDGDIPVHLLKKVGKLELVE